MNEIARKILLATRPAPRHALNDLSSNSSFKCMIDPQGFYSRGVYGCHQTSGHRGEHQNSLLDRYPSAMGKRKPPFDQRNPNSPTGYVPRHGGIHDECDIDDRAHYAETSKMFSMYKRMADAATAYRLNSLREYKRTKCPALVDKYLRIYREGE